MVKFEFTTDGTSDIKDREKECNYLSRIAETFGKGATEVFINNVSVKEMFQGASIHAKYDGKKPMSLEVVFSNGTGVNVSIGLWDKITIDRIDNNLFLRINA